VELKRTLNLFDATAIGIGAIIGAGIFVVLGVAVGYAGPAVIVSMVIAGTIALFAAISFAELGSAIPKEGGTYIFAYETLHPFPAFVSGCMWLFAQTVAGSAVCLGLASYFVSLFPYFPLKAVAVVAAIALTALNLVGLKHSARVNNILVVIKIIVLCFFVIVGVFGINSQNYSNFSPSGLSGILQGAGFLFFAYLGFGRIAALGEEVKNPKRTLPLSIFIALAASVILYIVTGVVATGLVNYKILAGSGSPLADAAKATGSFAVVATISLGALVATVSVLLTNLLGLSRVSFAMARNGQLPKTLAKVNSKFGTPHFSILATGAMMSVVAVFLNLLQTAAITSFSMLITHVILHSSAVRLRKKIPDLKTFKAPLFPLIPVLGVASCILLMYYLAIATIYSLVSSFIAIGIVSALYFAQKRFR
jgi:APA family basic amino acid/polyamine antiporter